LTISTIKRVVAAISVNLLIIGFVPVALFAAATTYYKVQIAQMSSDLREVAERSRSREYRRDAETPGWTLEDGIAADFYQQAWDTCWSESNPWDAPRSLPRASLAIQGHEASLKNNPFIPVEEAQLQAECESLGVTVESMDRVTAQLDSDLCTLYSRCEDALQLLRRGTRQRDNRSPACIWSEWAASTDQDSEGVTEGFVRLAELELIRAYLAGKRGDRTMMLDSLVTNLRFGRDCFRGSALHGFVLGGTIQMRAQRALNHHITHDELTLEEAQQLAAELSYELKQPIFFAEILEDFRLRGHADFPLWDGVETPASFVSWPSKLLLHEKLDAALAISTILDIEKRKLDMQKEPYVTRLQAYHQVDVDIDELLSGSVLKPITGQDWDARLVIHESQLMMTLIAVSDTIYRRKRGRLPDTLQDLQTVTPGLVLTDPLSSEDYLLTEENGRRFLRSPYHDPTRWPEFDIERLSGAIRASIELPMDAQLTPKMISERATIRSANTSP